MTRSLTQVLEGTSSQLARSNSQSVHAGLHREPGIVHVAANVYGAISPCTTVQKIGGYGSWVRLTRQDLGLNRE